MIKTEILFIITIYTLGIYLYKYFKGLALNIMDYGLLISTYVVQVILINNLYSSLFNKKQDFIKLFNLGILLPGMIYLLLILFKVDNYIVIIFINILIFIISSILLYHIIKKITLNNIITYIKQNKNKYICLVILLSLIYSYFILYHENLIVDNVYINAFINNIPLLLSALFIIYGIKYERKEFIKKFVEDELKSI